MANRYSKNKPRKVEPVPMITTIIVIAVCIFIAVDTSIGGATNFNNDMFLLRVELSSLTHADLNGTLTFKITEGIYEQVEITKIGNGYFVYTEKQYRGSYTLLFDGAGVSFGPITLSIHTVGTVFDGDVNNIHVKVDAVEG